VRTSCRHEAIKTLLFFAHTSNNNCEVFCSSLYPNSISTSHKTHRRFQSSSIYLATHLYQEVTKRHPALGPLAARGIPLLPHRTPPSNYHIPKQYFNTKILARLIKEYPARHKMISLKYVVVILTFASYSVATASLSSPDPYVEGLHLLKDPDHKKQHWDMVKSSLDEMFPGITCRIHTNNSTIQSPPNLITSSIESAFIDIHPSISCTGELDEEAFLKGLDKGSHVLEKRREVPVSFVLRLMIFVKEAKLQNLWYKRTRFATSYPSPVLISK